MTAQLSLEDAARAGQEGMNRAAENSGTAWISEARAWLRHFLKTNPVYLPDAAWAHGCPEPPNDRRAFGAVIRYAVTQGWMVAEGTHPRVSGHGTDGPKYRSKLYREPGC